MRTYHDIFVSQPAVVSLHDTHDVAGVKRSGGIGNRKILTGFVAEHLEAGVAQGAIDIIGGQRFAGRSGLPALQFFSTQIGHVAAQGGLHVKILCSDQGRCTKQNYEGYRTFAKHYFL